MAEGTLLIVDDEPGVTQLCTRLMTRAGFSAHSVTSPNEGVGLLERERVDLLLVDIRMPGMDGFRLIDVARRIQPDLAVVLMTGFGTVEMAIEALRRGADSLILKPFTGAELVDTVKRALFESQQKRDVVRLLALRPLFDVTESLFTETDPTRLEGSLLDALRGHLHCQYASLYQCGAPDVGTRMLSSRGEPAPNGSVPQQAVVERVHALGIPLWINREGPGEVRQQALLVESHLSSVLCSPMALKEDHLVLLAARAEEEPFFREADMEMFLILARSASAALENARLHAQLRAFIRQVEESQRALLQAEKMATAGRLTASIAHEINNPLQAVQNCLHLAGRAELPESERNSYLSLAQKELERLMNTVQRMLDFYRPGALDRKPEDINELTRGVLQLVGQQLRARGINLQTRYARKMPTVLVVGDQIRQVLLNLLLNAMEAMENGGDLFLETSAHKREVEVIIEDTGPGVALDERPHIFEPFVSTKPKGTGLGLAVSYGIVAAHGGNLDLVAGRGRGACFRMTLPVEVQL